MCQKEVLVKSDGIHYRKSCASSGACLIASSGYQQFCTGRLNSVCISCCNTPLCNGPKRKRPTNSAATTTLQTNRPLLLFLLALLLLLLT
uniref:LY6/PLAUR domain containing 1 n=2 Tax=Haplochromini TaxID=319058 RepID=A0A3B4FM98_9CICH